MPRATDAKPSALLGTWGPGDLGLKPACCSLEESPTELEFDLTKEQFPHRPFY